MGGRKRRGCTFNNGSCAFQKLASEEAEKKKSCVYNIFLHSQHFQTVINAFCNMHSASDGKSLDRIKWKIPTLNFFF